MSENVCRILLRLLSQLGAQSYQACAKQALLTHSLETSETNIYINAKDQLGYFTVSFSVYCWQRRAISWK